MLVVEPGANVSLETLVVTGGWANETASENGFGGGIAIQGGATATLQNVVIAGNGATLLGGGILLFGAETVTIASSLVAANLSFGSGAGLGSFGETGVTALEVTSTSFSQNVATGAGFGGTGGAMFLQGTSTSVAESAFSQNQALVTGDVLAPAQGGAIYINSGTLAIAASDFFDNVARATGGTIQPADILGGAILNAAGEGAVRTVDVSFSGNEPDDIAVPSEGALPVAFDLFV